MLIVTVLVGDGGGRGGGGGDDDGDHDRYADPARDHTDDPDVDVALVTLATRRSAFNRSEKSTLCFSRST